MRGDDSCPRAVQPEASTHRGGASPWQIQPTLTGSAEAALVPGLQPFTPQETPHLPTLQSGAGQDCQGRRGVEFWVPCPIRMHAAISGPGQCAGPTSSKAGGPGPEAAEGQIRAVHTVGPPQPIWAASVFRKLRRSLSYASHSP